MRIALTDFGGRGRPLLVVGPSLGTTVSTLWGAAAASLIRDYHVIGWDLPGHGDGAPADSFTVEELAAAVLNVLGPRFSYAGVSVSGAVGLQLLVDAPDRVERATLLATGARFGEPDAWTRRAAQVRANGTAPLVEQSRERWFAPKRRNTALADTLLAELANTDAASYAAACQALAAFDVGERLAEIAVPVIAVAGAHDEVTSPATLRRLAGGVQHGRLVILDDAAHQIPAEEPAAVATILAMTAQVDNITVAQVRAEGMRARREVLGDAHVDQVCADADEFSTEFQQFITCHAWGSIWTRPGLDRRSRSLITLTALVARGHHEELALHLRAALTHGLSRTEITELLLQTAIYCGVPDANSAFRIARRVIGGDA